MDYEIYLHTYEMLEDRKYQLPKLILKNDFVLMGSVKNYYVTINNILIYDKTATESFIKTDYLKITALAKNVSASHIIIIISGYNTKNTKKIILLNKVDVKTEIFSINEIYINPVRNVLSPKYTLIPRNEFTDFNPDDLKIIYSDDIAMRWLDFKSGDIIKVINMGDTSINLNMREIDIFRVVDPVD